MVQFGHDLGRSTCYCFTFRVLFLAKTCYLSIAFELFLIRPIFERWDQPRRVGSFSGGPADLQGSPIFPQMRKREQNESRGCSTLAGGAGPRDPLPPDATGWMGQITII